MLLSDLVVSHVDLIRFDFRISHSSPHFSLKTILFDDADGETHLIRVQDVRSTCSDRATDTLGLLTHLSDNLVVSFNVLIQHSNVLEVSKVILKIVQEGIAEEDQNQRNEETANGNSTIIRGPIEHE